MKTIICACVAVGLIPFSLLAQGLEQKLPSKSLIEDFEILERHLKTVHPGLYTYHDEEEFDSIFSTYKQKFQKDLSPMEFYREIGTLIEVIGDAHTEIEPPESFYESLNNEYQVFPISTLWLDATLYTLKDFSDTPQTQAGDEIISINEVDAKEAFRELRRYVPRDGKNVSSPNHTLSGIFGQLRNYYASLYGTPEIFRLKVRSKNGEIKNIRVEGLKYKDIYQKYDAEAAARPQKARTLPLSLSLQENVAILTVESFHPGVIKDAKQSYKKFFKQSFKTIREKNIEHLILDLRGNGGGSEIVFIELAKYLLKQPFRAYKQLHTITDRIPQAELYLEQDYIQYLERKESKRLKKIGDVYIPQNEIGTSTVEVAKETFNGDLLVLIDGKTSSAAGDFCGLLDSFDRASFMGEESGGNPYVNTAGNRFTLVLPNSKLQIIIPNLLYTINHTGPNEGHGMIPDYPVEPGIEDLLSSRDIVLDKALELMQN